MMISAFTLVLMGVYRMFSHSHEIRLTVLGCDDVIALCMFIVPRKLYIAVHTNTYPGYDVKLARNTLCLPNRKHQTNNNTTSLALFPYVFTLIHIYIPAIVHAVQSRLLCHFIYWIHPKTQIVTDNRGLNSETQTATSCIVYAYPCVGHSDW